MAKKSKTLRKKSSFSKGSFMLYMFVFAIVGAFTLWVSFAAGPGTCTPKTPGVNMDNNYRWATPGSWGLAGQRIAYHGTILNYDTGCATSNFTLSVSAPDGFNVSVPITTFSVKATTQAYFWAYVTSPTPIADGDYPVTLTVTRASDSASTATATNYYKVYSTDTSAPTLYWNSPSQGMAISSKGKNSSNFNVSISANDDHTTKQIETYIDGALVDTMSCDGISYSCTSYFGWSPKGKIGQHTATWKASDWLGNVATSTASFTVN